MWLEFPRNRGGDPHACQSCLYLTNTKSTRGSRIREGSQNKTNNAVPPAAPGPLGYHSPIYPTPYESDSPAGFLRISSTDRRTFDPTNPASVPFGTSEPAIRYPVARTSGPRKPRKSPPAPAGRRRIGPATDSNGSRCPESLPHGGFPPPESPEYLLPFTGPGVSYSRLLR